MLNAANNAKTTLAQAIDASATSFIVADASAFPDAPFRITVDNEIMEVGTINKATNTFSDVTRGVEDTVATSHDVGASVENRWTAGTYKALITDLDTLSDELWSAFYTLRDNSLDHFADTNNPHNVTKAQLGLGNVDNMSATEIRTATNYSFKVEVVSSSGSVSPDAGRIIFDTSQGKFFGGTGSEWV